VGHEANEMNQEVVKQAWARPVLQRLEAGSAESAVGTVTDNSSPQES
jgi:hypothetical protein